VVAPIETTNTPSVQDICVGGESEELIVTNTTGAGNISYQWFSNTINNNTTGTLIPGAVNANYTPPGPFNNVGSFYFYVVISDDAAGCFDVPSDVYIINVVADPTVTIDPIGPLTYCQNATSDTLTATPNGGVGTTYGYQWYSNTTNSNVGGTQLTGETNSTFTPPTLVVETTYYFVEITQTASGCTNRSIPVAVTITLGPSITTQPVPDAVCINGTTPDLSVAYINGTGTPTYKWYLTTDPLNPVGTNPTYPPPTDVAGVFSYYVVISFSDLGDGACSVITSEIVDIIVYQTPILSDFTTTICSEETFSIDPDESNGDIVPIGTTYTWSAPVINPVGAILGASGETTPQNNISQTLSNPISGVIATATYTVIPNSEICPGDPFTIVVTVNPQINVEAIVTNSACFEFDNAQIEITITGGVPFTTGNPFIISWLKDGVDYPGGEDIINLEPGTYTLIITDSEGCEFTDTYIITQPEELLLGSLDVFEDITCFGFDDGQIAVTIIGGTLDYTYQWKRNGVDYPGEENLTNLPPGIYVLTVTDENGCILVLDPLEIIEPALLTITLIDKVDIDCYGFNTGSIDIEANGGRPGYTYSWTGPPGFPPNTNPDISNLFPGTYTLVVTDTSGCTETLTEVIVQNDEITATINVTDVTCYGYNNGIIEIESIVGGVPFTTGDPYDILWSNLGSGLLQENLSPGIYTITITDALGCQRQYEIEVLEAPIFTLDPDVDQISCSGEDDGRIAINIVGGVAPLTVSWLDDPSAGIVRNNLPPGIYNVTVTDSSPIGPCVIEQEFVILPVAPLEISATVTDAFDCDDPNSGSINLSITGGTVSSTSSYSITWSNGVTTEDLINIGPGVYFVTVVDDNNCQITGQWEVNRFDPLDVTVTTETVADCDTRELYQVFTASTTGGIPDYTYLWSSGEVSGVNGEIMTATQNGTVTLTVTDSIGCVANYSFNVDLPEIGEVNFDQTSAGFINFGFYSILEPIQFINLSDGDFEEIIWDFGDGNFSNQENPTHTYTTPGTYTVTLTVTYPFGCTYTYTSVIIIEKGYKLVFPNAFTPNQDNLNDYFRPEYAGLNNIELRIFDTWGSQIYFESGNNISGWNGILKNKLAENGNYYYTFKAKTSYGEIILQDGPFTLIR
ncbi:PKD domain-containing protein, partial [bacterium]|nr:PKD domain-containing protein [bacterium]